MLRSMFEAGVKSPGLPQKHQSLGLCNAGRREPEKVDSGAHRRTGRALAIPAGEVDASYRAGFFFLASTFSAAAMMSGDLMPKAAISSSCLPERPKRSWTATSSMGTG